MRTKTEIIKELNEVQTLCDRLLMGIGLGYAHTRLKDDNSLIASVNQKIESFKKAEAEFQTLEQELANAVE